MKLMAIAVPGQVMPGSSGNEVVAKLGGYDAIARAHKGEELLSLNLSVNPDRGHLIASRDENGKPCALLVTVKHWSNGRTTTEIIGAAASMFRFNRPADFIHISHHPVVTGLELCKNPIDAYYAMAPPYFTKIPAVANIFKEGISSAPQIERAEKEQENQMINQVVQFEDAYVPTGPLHSSLGATPDETLMVALDELFMKRPVWLRSSLDEHLPQTFTSWKKKIAFSRTCYIFSDGPWRGCMCRLGYDPRSDPSSRMYQIIDYRDPYYRTISWKTEKQGNTKSGQEPETVAYGVDSTFKSIISTVRNFNPEVHFLIPPSRQSQLYQLCDIFDAGIQKIINETVETGQVMPRTCSKTTGWYSQATLSKIRDMMNVKSLRMRQNRYITDLE